MEHMPPRLATRLLQRLIPFEYREAVLADLEEAFVDNVRCRGLLVARLRYWREVFAIDHFRLRAEARRRRLGAVNTFTNRGLSMLHSTMQEFRYALRGLAKSPTTAAIAVLVLGLGIGASTSVFSVVNGVLLRPLPYHAPEQLVFIWDRMEWIGVPRAWVAPAEIADLRDRVTTFEGLAAVRVTSRDLEGEGRPERINVGLASANTFELLGVRPLLGRTFEPGEEGEDAPPVAVLSYDFWQRRFGGDPSVLQQTVQLNGQAVPVVGILPPEVDFQVHGSLSGPRSADLWIPLDEDLRQVAREDGHYMGLLGRVKDDVSLDAARAELATISREYDEQWYANSGFAFVAAPLHDDLVRAVRPTLLVLLGAVALVLLIAASNIATLLLSRSQARAHDAAVQAALGASRSRILGRPVAEGIWIALAGTGLGLLLSVWGMNALVAIAPAELPLAESVTIDWRIVAFAGVLAMGTVLLCGLVPGWQISRPNLAEAFKGARGQANAPATQRMRALFVTVQLALSVMLLVGAGLMIRSFGFLHQVDPGFRPGGLVYATITMSQHRFGPGEERIDFLDGLLERLRHLPGVERAAATTSLPLEARTRQWELVPDVLAGTSDAGRLVDVIATTPGYFETMGIEVLDGRDFGPAVEMDTATFQVVIDEILARHWPEGQAVGRSLMMEGGETRATIIGVVRHARQYQVHRDDRAQVYFSHNQFPARTMSLVVKTSRPQALLAALADEVEAFDHQQPIMSVGLVEEMVARSIAPQRFSLQLMVGFAVTALILAGLGVYGVLAYTVGRRTPEIGLRMALGAESGAVLRLIMRQGAVLAAVGTVVGLAGAWGLSGVIGSLLIGVSSTDLVTYAGVSAVLFAVALLACYLPARRASLVDPLVALREE